MKDFEWRRYRLGAKVKCKDNCMSITRNESCWHSVVHPYCDACEMADCKYPGGKKVNTCEPINVAVAWDQEVI